MASPTLSPDVEQCVDDALTICGVSAPTGDEEDRASWLVNALTSAGLRAVSLDEVGNVLARLGPTGPALLVAAHLDTVFPREVSTFATRDGSRLTGPGIGDNSLGVAGLLWLARRIGAAALPAPLILAGTVAEEGLGNLRGARHLVSACDVAEFIALEGTLQDKCVIRGVGSLRFRVSMLGPGGHSWLDRGAPSAAHALIRLLHELVNRTNVECVNVNAITSEGSVNTIAPVASALVEFRDLDQARLDEAEQTLASMQICRDGSLQMTVDLLGRRPSGATDAAHPLVNTVLSARQKHGLPRAVFRESSTDANAAMAIGIPAVTVGLAQGGRAHTIQEWADITNLPQGLRMLETLVDDRLDGISRTGAA